MSVHSVKMRNQNRKIMSLCSWRLYGSGGGPRAIVSGCSFLLGIDGVLGAEESVIFFVVDTLFDVVAIVRRTDVHKLKNKLILQKHYRGDKKHH